MNFQQLRIIREAVRQNYNLTEVANALFTSQSGVSKHIKDLEDELGVELFVRRGKRLLGLTEPGKELVGIVERMLLDARNIKRLALQFSQRDEGKLVVATTHTQARYVLPPVVTRFKREFPKVHLELQQSSPKEIAALLQSGEVDIGIATEALDGAADLVTFEYHRWHHAVVVPPGHPLLAAEPLTLEAIAEHPIVTYTAGYTGRNRIDQRFADAGLAPDIVLSALDADVIKTYVELGLGIGIVASVALNAERDHGLVALPQSTQLFDENVTRLAVRHGHYLRGFAYRFIEFCQPGLTEETVKSAIDPAREVEE
jgi:LysR family transcriptional regulator, cys regulon transcriptional activator